MHSTKISSLDINVISTQTRVGMLRNFIRHHELNFVFFQEVTDPAILTVTVYIIYVNIGANMRMTTLLARQGFSRTNDTCLTTGRVIPSDYNGLRLVNVYAPAGTANRTDRE
jgi:exonuclease III